MIGNKLLAQRYELVELVRQSGPLYVYRAVDRRLARPVTVELLDKSVADPRQIALFQHRARKLAGRPSARLVGVHDVGEDQNAVYAVLEPLQGTTIAEVLSRHAPLPIAEAVERVVALSAAVEAANEQQLLDSLPDPASVYVREANRVKLGGLLFAGPDREPLPSDAPAREQLLVQWLAMLLVELLSSPAHGGAETVADLPPTVPAGLKRLITRAIEPDPADPLLSLKDWSHALERYQSAGQHVTVSVPRPVVTAPRTAVLPRATTTVPSRYGGAAAAAPRWQQDAGSTMGCLSTFIALLILIVLVGGIGAFAFWLGSSQSPPRLPGTVATDVSATDTPRPTPTRTPTRAAVATANAAATKAAASAEQSPTATPTPTATATATTTPTVTATATTTATPTVTPTAAPTAAPSPTPVALVAVPNLVGQQFGQAAAVAAKLNLQVQKEADEETSQAPPGQIIAQTPGQGAAVPASSVINVIVAKAPAGSRVPDVTGQPLAQAQAALAQAGLTSKATQEASPQVPEGRVIGQSIPPGSQVPRGSQIVLTVSVGDKVAVPNVVGLGEDEAQQRILDAGLATAPANHSGTSPRVAVGRVESEDPPAGALVARGTVVHINVRTQ